jgi:hypothetical protein
VNSRERILAAIQHRPVDRVPTDIWATVEVQDKLYEHLGIRAGAGTKPCGIGLMGGALTRDVEGILALYDRLQIDGVLAVRRPTSARPDGTASITRTDGAWACAAKYATASATSRCTTRWRGETVADLERCPGQPGLVRLRCAAGHHCPLRRRAIAAATAPFYYHNLLLRSSR